jgi:hypothetical protein
VAKPKISGDNRIVVDWDGTCAPIKWPAKPAMWSEAADAMHDMLNMGYDVVISSTRFAPRAVDEKTSLERPDKDAERRYVRRELDAYELSDVGIWLKPWKPGARFYIDDKAVTHPGTPDGWDLVMEEIFDRRGI